MKVAIVGVTGLVDATVVDEDFIVVVVVVVVVGVVVVVVPVKAIVVVPGRVSVKLGFGARYALPCAKMAEPRRLCEFMPDRAITDL